MAVADFRHNRVYLTKIKQRTNETTKVDLRIHHHVKLVHHHDRSDLSDQKNFQFSRWANF